MASSDRIADGRWRVPEPSKSVTPSFVSAFDDFPGPKELLRVLRRHKVLAASVIVPITLLATIYGFLAPERYQATAMMALNPKDAPLRNLGALPGQLIRDMPILETQLHVVLSPVVLNDVADRLDLAENPAFVSPPSVKTHLVDLIEAQAAQFDDQLADLKQVVGKVGSGRPGELTRDDVVYRLARDMSVEQVGQSYAMTLSYKAADPVLAASIVNETARSYIRHQLNSKLETTGGAANYLQVRLAQLRDEVEKADDDLETYRSKNALPVEGSEESLSSRVNDLTSELIGTRSEIAVTDARLNSLRSLQKNSDPSVLARALDSQTAETLSVEAASLARRRAELLSSFGEQHPAVQALRADESALRRTIRAEAERSIAEVGRNLDLLRVKAQETGREIAATEEKIARDQHAMVQIANLKRDAEVNRRLYEEMLTQRKLLTEQQSLVQPDVEIVAEASADIRSSSPPLTFYPIVGFVGSSALATLLALLRDRNDPRVRSARQLARLTGHPIIGRLPSEASFRKIRPEHYVEHHPNSSYSESLRHIYHHLEAARSEEESLVVLVTSPAEGEGKSSTVSGLAALLRRSGKRVAVLDLDLRRPRLVRLFGEDQHAATINDLLALEADAWEREIALLLTRSFIVITARPAGQEVLSLLESRQLSATIKSLRLRYDYVLLDTPPVLPTSDAPLLSRYADATVMICQWLVTEVAAVREASERMTTQAPHALFGIAVNQIDGAAYATYARSYGEQSPLDGSYPYGASKR